MLLQNTETFLPADTVQRANSVQPIPQRESERPGKISNRPLSYNNTALKLESSSPFSDRLTTCYKVTEKGQRSQVANSSDRIEDSDKERQSDFTNKMADRGMNSTTAGHNEEGKGKKDDQTNERRASEAESGGAGSQERRGSQESILTLSDTAPDFGPDLDRAIERTEALLRQRGRGPWNPFIGEFHPEHYDLETRTSSRHHGGPESAEQRRRSSISKVNRYLDSLPPIPSMAESSSNPPAPMAPPARPQISREAFRGPERSPPGGNIAHQAAPVARVQMPSAIPRAVEESMIQRSQSRAKRIEQRNRVTHEPSQDEPQIYVKGGLAELSPSSSGWVSKATGGETPYRPVPYHLGPMQYFAPDPQFPCGYLSAPTPPIAPTASGSNQPQYQRHNWQPTRMPHTTQSGRSGEAEGSRAVPSGEMQWEATGSSQPRVESGNGPGHPGMSPKPFNAPEPDGM